MASPDPGQFLSHVVEARNTEDLFAGLYEPRSDEDQVATLRRRRRRVSNDGDSAIKSVSLVEENGTLYWRDGIPAREVSGRRQRRGWGEQPEGTLVLPREFPVLAPNKVIAAVGMIDQRLNPAIDGSLQSRLRSLKRTSDGRFELQATAPGPFSGRTLLFVHGTFSSATNMLGEFTAPGAPGIEFIERAMRGPNKYDQVLFFDHPTLAVSPVMNGLELGRAMAGTTGSIDVIAHSRGGLVVRWWLEALGGSLRITAPDGVRAILAGSPLYGTSLAAPDKIQHALSLLSNIGTLAEGVLKLTGAANPFLWVAGKLVEVVVSVTGTLARTPIVDGLTALVPGLAGQSRVSNNHELTRLRLGPCVIDPQYFAIVSNFETEDPRWQFWKNFRKDRAIDLATDVLFPKENDLVVDTDSMTDFGVPRLKLAGPACDFGNSATVWHCSYFREPKALKYIGDTFKH
jgi:pimeloyl-ACP methyl ester carboxylesterase